MSRPGGHAIPNPPRERWQYGLILTPVQEGLWDVLWIAQLRNGQRSIWDHWTLAASPGARTAVLLASDTWVAATELCERQTGA